MTWQSFLKPEEKERLEELQTKRVSDLKEIRRIKDTARRRMKRMEARG
jgi:hypothetical protein